MKNFGDKKRSGGFKGKRFGSQSDRGGSDMHDAVCANCGKNCKVPFKPNGRKPVYCSDCFENETGGRDDNRSFERKDKPYRHDNSKFAQKPGNSIQTQLDEINKKIDIILNAVK